MNLLSPLGIALAIWTLWGGTWLAASLWKGREVARGASGPTIRWLAIVTLGFAGLFVENPTRLHPLWQPPTGAAWGLVLLVAAGMALAWWARLHLGRLWSGGVVAREGHRIVDTGPYAIVRHPIYTALFMGAAGLAGIKATPLALAGTLLMVVGFAGKARVEERFLEAQLGPEAYRGYRARVPMLLPFPRP